MISTKSGHISKYQQKAVLLLERKQRESTWVGWAARGLAATTTATEGELVVMARVAEAATEAGKPGMCR